MNRPRTALLFVTGCIASATIGFWFGFREALPLGLAADFMPRGVIAVQQLQALRSAKTQNLVTALEFSVDDGLIWGYDVVHHPLRHLWGPVWGWNVYPEFEKYAVRLADHRKQYPSPLKADVFDKVPPDQPELEEWYKDLALGVRESTKKRDWMIDRYATPR